MSNIIKVHTTPKTSLSYNIIVGYDVINLWNKYIPDLSIHRQIVIITDTTVYDLYTKTFIDGLVKAGYKVLTIKIKPGEKSKTHKVKEDVENQMLEHGCDHHTLCVAFGGGVVGDLAGFVSATYMRGIEYIQIPTTLLAMVDSSIGGKVAINTKYGKNLIGAFWQPVAVVVDFNYLHSLPKIHKINGLIEIIKICLTLDKKSFSYIDECLNEMLTNDDTLKNTTNTRQEFIIKQAIKLKAKIIQKDTQETNLRMILNFGHTVGHAIEKVSKYKILHGYAVGLGILVEAKISHLMGLLSKDDYITIVSIFKRLNIEINQLKKYNKEDLIAAMFGDKKNYNGRIRCVLLKRIGEVVKINDMVAIDVDTKYIDTALSIYLRP